MADKSNAAYAERLDKFAGRKPAAAATGKSRATPGSGEISATQLDRLIHERTRLAIVSALAANAIADFFKN